VSHISIILNVSKSISGEIYMITTLPLLVVGKATIDKAVSKIDSCILCFPQAEYEFSYVLDLVRNAGVNEEQYFLADPVYCPRCSSQIKEHTLVQISDS